MFGKICNNCNSRIKKSFDFCPHCGKGLNSRKEDFGLLGKNDSIEELDEPEYEHPFLSQMFNKALKELPAMIKMIEKQMHEPKSNQKNENLHIQFFVNGKKVFSQENHKQLPQKPKQVSKKIVISKDKINKLSKLPKTEAISKVRRLANKVIYEINVPGVESPQDIFINQLENSIEIKALAQDRVYTKNIKLNTPITNFKLINGNLILEMAQSPY